MTAEAPYHWVKKVEEGLAEAKIIPLWGAAPPFEWEECADRLSQVLMISPLTLSPQETEWREAGELLTGLGEHPIHLSFELTPLAELVHWVLPAKDVEKLIEATLTQEPHLKSFSDRFLQEGFYAFLAMKAMYAVDSLKSFGNLSLKLLEMRPLPKEGALCLDIAVGIKEETIWGRLITPPAFLHVFRNYFSRVKSSLFSTELRQQIDVDLHVEIGRASLFLEEIKRLSTGDFILLHNASFDPQAGKGIITAFLESTPLFRAELSEGHLTILDYSFYHEEAAPMSKKDYHEEDDEFEEDEEEESSEEENLSEDDEDDFEDDEFEEEEDDGDNEDEEEELEQSEENEEEGEEEAEHLERPSKVHAREEARESPLKEVIATEKIPVTVSVEIARLRMNLDKLLELKPGNVLDLSIGLQEPVDLRLNGKTIAKAELLRLGDLLGVRILRIGEL
jgi:flagellar motor switch protein FliN